MKVIDIILKDIQETTKSFDRIVTAGLLFALLGHLYVVEPYFLYKEGGRAIASELQERQDEVQGLLDQLARLEATQKGIDQALRDIKNRIRSFPDHLREMLPEIQRNLSGGSPYHESQQIPPYPFQENAPYQQALSHSLETILAFPPEVKTFDEGVRWYTNSWFSQTIEELKERVIDPTSRIEMAVDSGLKDRLSSLSRDAIKKVTNYVHNIDPNFWHSYSGGKVPVAMGLYEVVDESMQPLYGEVTRLMEKFNTVIKEKKNTISELKIVIEEIKGRETILESRLKSLESPIGKIPVGLTDFIKLFPLLMVILIVVMTIYLRRGKRLCDGLMLEYFRNRDDIDERILGYYTNLWYLMSYKGIMNPLLLLIISVIAGFFIRSVFLVTGDEELFVSLTGKASTNAKFLFITIYLIGLMVIAGCLWFVQKGLVKKDAKPG